MCVKHQETRSESLVIYAMKSQHRPKLAPSSLALLNQVLDRFPRVATPFTHDIACRIKYYQKKRRKKMREQFPVLQDGVKSDQTHKNLNTEDNSSPMLTSTHQNS